MRSLTRGFRPRRLVVACFALAVLAGAEAPTGQISRSGTALQTLQDKAQAQGTVRVIVGLSLPFAVEGAMTDVAAVSRQRTSIARAQDDLLARLPGIRLANVKRLETVPFIAVEVDPVQLAELASLPDVISIEEDVLLRPFLMESVPRIGAPAVWASGYTGTGQMVAILDTGVDKTHPFLGDRVASEACYSTTGGDKSSLCPGGVTESTAVGSGLNCTGIDGCDHGTHVAGIAAGQGESYSGVAKDAQIAAIQVFTRIDNATACGGTAPCLSAYDSDILKGLERVHALRTTFNMAAANLSLGGNTRYTSNCDSTYPSMKSVIDTLRSAGIATVIASGNESWTDGIAFPACISSAVSVGSVDDGSNGTTADQVSAFSNSASFLSLLAPGRWITSSVPGGGTATWQGTSMAAPHVTGAWALMKQKSGGGSVDTVLGTLTSTGIPVTDWRNQIVKPRIQLDAPAIGCGTIQASAFSDDTRTAGVQGQTAGASGCPDPAQPVSPASAPVVAGLPPGGVWVPVRRPGGESWSYTFNVEPEDATLRAPASAGGPQGGQAAAAISTLGESQALSPSRIAGIGTAEASPPEGPEPASRQLTGAAAPGGSGATTQIRIPIEPDGPQPNRLIQPRFVTASDPESPQVLDAGQERYEIWVPPGGNLPETVAWLNPTLTAGWVPVAVNSTDIEQIVAAGVKYRRVRANPLPGKRPEGQVSYRASGWSTIAARLASAAALEPPVPGQQVRVSAFDLDFEDLRESLEVDSTRVALKIANVDVNSLVVWLSAAGRDVVLWDGRVSPDDARFGDSPGDGLVIDRLFDGELSAVPLVGRWTVYIADSSRESGGVLEALSIAIEARPLGYSKPAAGLIGPAATLDIEAQRAYLRTAANGGSEVDLPTIGQTVYFHLDWQVTGSGGAVSVSVRAVLDDGTICSGTLSASPGQTFATWCTGGWAATAGSHTLRWDLDYNNTVTETNEANNSATKTFTPTGLDIEAQRAYLRTTANGGSEVPTPTVGQTVYFHLDWRVTGSGSAVSVTSRAVLDGGTFCNTSFSASPGQTFTTWCSSGWAATAGSHTLRWDLDYNDAVDETNEANNSATKTFTPSGLDIEAQRAYLRTAANGGTEVDPPTIGQTVYFHLAWQVTGSGSAVSVSARAVFDGGTFCSGSFTASPGQAFSTWCDSGWTATEGSHTLRWDLDYNNAVAETNEANNSATKDFDVAPAAGLDIEAQRAYLRTAANGGTEVDPPTIGQTVYFHLAWQVTGSGSAVSVSARAVLDGGMFCSGSFTASPGQAFTVWCTSGWAATAGSHTLRWDLDYNDTVAETNEANNSATKLISVPAPDLDIEAQRAYLRTAANGGSEVPAPTVGQTVYFSLDWRVTGSGSAVTVTERAVLDGVAFCACSIPATPGQSYRSSCSEGWRVVGGSHVLSWELDYAGGLSEANENNNSAAMGPFSPLQPPYRAPLDFDGDSKSDILWWHATRGEVWLWPMDGAARTAETYVRAVADTNWEIRGLGDQTGDGKPDILWRNKTTGVVYLWPMDGSTPLSETYVATVDPAYDIVGTGDFDGDGKSDILWRHLTNGEVWTWLMDGATAVSRVYVGTVDPAYVIKGVGDLDGDGKADIVWHHATVGEVWVWLMDGATRLSATWVATVPDVGYRIQGVADFDGDGKADILWHHATTGEVWLWRMDGPTRLAETWVGAVPDTGYQVVGTGDHDGDGKADILWHHATAGEVWVWLMDGATRLAETWVATVPDAGYRIIKVK